MDQVAIVNTQHSGYVPYYNYATKQRINPVPEVIYISNLMLLLQGKFNVFFAIAMIYAQIAKIPGQKYGEGLFSVSI